MRNPFGAKKVGTDPTGIILPYSFPVLGGNTYLDKRAYLNNVNVKTQEWAHEIIKSYLKKQEPVRTNAKILRHLTIIFGAFGGLIPLMVGIGISKPIPVFAGLEWLKIGYLSLGLAAIFISYDKFFGFSSSWIRYVETSNALKILLAEFQYDWAVLDSQLVNCQLYPELCDKGLPRIKKFVLDVLSEVKGESSKWAAEYSDSIADIEKTYGQQDNKNQPSH